MTPTLLQLIEPLSLNKTEDLEFQASLDALNIYQGRGLAPGPGL